VARTSQNTRPPQSAPCAGSQAPSPGDNHLFDDIAPDRLDWYDALPRCNGSRRVTAKTSLARRAKGKGVLGASVTLRGHLAIEPALDPPVEFLDDDGPP